MIAGSTSTGGHESDERREAARALLVNPMLAARGHADELALVRRHATALKSSFATTLGYHLIVESRFARLVKAPLSAEAPTRPARRSSGAEFTPRAYVFLSLVCAGLLAPDTGEQVLLSNLVVQLRVDAAAAGISVDDAIGDRRLLVATVGLLVDWGVLVETDGTLAGWGERREEALLTVTRGLLPHLLARPLHTLTAPDELWQEPAGPVQPRRSLRRKLVENPLVRREDLTEAERDVLSRERTELTRVLQEAFGLTVEVRADGALAFDAAGDLTDIAFPGPGTVRQAALLLLDALVDTIRPAAGAQTVLAGQIVAGFLAGWDQVDDLLADLIARYRRVWSEDLVADITKLRAEVVATLSAMSLANAADHGLVVHPAAARYRPQPQRFPAKTQARTRTGIDAGKQTQDLLATDLETS